MMFEMILVEGLMRAFAQLSQHPSWKPTSRLNILSAELGNESPSTLSVRPCLRRLNWTFLCI